MSKHLRRDMDLIRRELLSQFGVVEKMIDDAVRALCEYRVDLCKSVLNADNTVDNREVQIEEECLKALALHQPVAIDLRWLTTVLKLNYDLERIGDLACNIVERAQAMHAFPHFPIPDQIPEMVRDAMDMVRKALDAFVDLDVARAQEVIKTDSKVDTKNREAIDVLVGLMKESPILVEPALHCFSAARHIERIADHAENIAEEVVYIVEGEIVRHKHGEFSTSNLKSTRS